MIINGREDRLALWAVSHAVGNKKSTMEEIAKARKESNIQDGEFDVHLIVDGVELDFSLVIKRMSDMFDSAVAHAAGEMYLKEYDRRADEITELLSSIGNRLRKIRAEKFPEEKWDNDNL